MRTILNIDEDVLDRARTVSRKKGLALRQVINESLRYGLDAAEGPLERREYHTRPRRLKMREGRRLDNIQELLSEIEGDAARTLQA